MKTQSLLTAVAFLTLSSSAMAAHVMQLAPLPACADIAKNAPVGTHCRTSEKIEFKRYQNQATGQLGWEDIGMTGQGGVGGKIWYDGVVFSVNAQEAMNYCASQKLDLPSKQDYQYAQNHGIAEVLKDSPEQIYWSSDVSQSRSIGLFGGQPYFTGAVKTSLVTYPYFAAYSYTDQHMARCNGVSGVNIRPDQE